MALALFENIGLALASGVPAYMEAKKLAMDAREAAQQRRAARVMAALEDQEFAAKNRLEEMERISKAWYDTYKVVPDADGMVEDPLAALFGTGPSRIVMTPDQRDYRLTQIETMYRNMAASFREDFPQYANAVYFESPRDQLVQFGLASQAGAGDVIGETEPFTVQEFGMEDTGIGADTTAAPGPAMQSPSTGFNIEDYAAPAMRLLGQGLDVLRMVTPVGPGSMRPIDPSQPANWVPDFLQSINPLQWGAPQASTPYQPGLIGREPEVLGPNSIQGPTIMLPEEEEEDLNQGLPATYQPQ